MGDQPVDGPELGRVPRVFDDAPSQPATLYRHAADAGVASWRRTLPLSSRRLWSRPRSSASTDGASGDGPYRLPGQEGSANPSGVGPPEADQDQAHRRWQAEVRGSL